VKAFNGLFENKITSLYSTVLVFAMASLFVAQHIKGVSLIGLAILLWIIVWIIEGNFKGKFQLFKQPWLWFSIALYALYIIGIFYSTDTAKASIVIEHKLTLLLAPLLLGAGLSFRRQHLVLALFTFVNAGVLASIAAYSLALYNGLSGVYAQSALIDYITYENLAQAIGFQPIYFSLYLVFAFFALLALFSDERFNGQWFYQNRILAFSALLFIFLTIVLLSSRMELLALIITAVLTLLVFVKNKKLIFKALGLLVVVSVVGAVVILSSSVNRQRFTEMFDFKSDYTENIYGGRSVRIEKWKNTIECWSQSPVFGVGTGDMQTELNKIYEKNNFEVAIIYKFNPHNQYLETALAIGIPGLLVLLCWMFTLFLLGIKTGDWLLFSFGSVVSVSMITESMLERQWGVVFIAIFSAMLITWNLKYFRKTSPETNP
jgi:O-antigen ligase